MKSSDSFPPPPMPSMEKKQRWGLRLVVFCIMLSAIFCVGHPIYVNLVAMYLKEDVRTVRSDMRTIAIGLEGYYADHGEYPAFSLDPMNSAAGIVYRRSRSKRQPWNTPTFRMRHATQLATLTTPVAYINYLLADPFANERERSYHYYSSKVGELEGWILYSPGPDGDVDITETDYDIGIPQPSLHLTVNRSYDPTNGTASDGDVWRLRQ